MVSRQVLAPNVNGTIANCRNAKWMTKIDIIRAFNLLLMHADSRYLTAFKTCQGTFRWKVLPFGLKVGPAWWQAFINAQLNELLDLFASAYADDVLVYTDEDSDEAHFNKVEEVVYRLHRAELQGDPVVPGTVQLYPSVLPPRQRRSRATDALAQERHTARPRP